MNAQLCFEFFLLKLEWNCSSWSCTLNLFWHRCLYIGYLIFSLESLAFDRSLILSIVSIACQGCDTCNCALRASRMSVREKQVVALHLPHRAATDRACQHPASQALSRFLLPWSVIPAATCWGSWSPEPPQTHTREKDVDHTPWTQTKSDVVQPAQEKHNSWKNERGCNELVATVWNEKYI